VVAPPRPAAPSPRAGFTFVEIILVLAVIAIAGALAAPAIGPALQAVRGEAAARRTASFLDDVRRRAVLERRTLSVRCDPQEERLLVSGEPAKEEAAGEEAVSFRIPEEADLVSCSPEEARYFPQGYATGLELLLRDRSERQYRVAVGSFTGLARAERAP
jgi:general secretion pathway protein H